MSVEFNAGKALRGRVNAAVAPFAPAVTGPMNVARRGISAMLGAPVRMGKNTTLDILLGSKAKMGPMAGKRLKPVSGGPGKGMREIDAARFKDIKSGKIPGKAYEGRIGIRNMHFERKFRPGGLVGAAYKHPIYAGIGAYLLYQMLSNQNARTMARGVAGGAVPRTDIDPNIVAQFQPTGDLNNPLARSVWG
jgi:hypothetical protein